MILFNKLMGLCFFEIKFREFSNERKKYILEYFKLNSSNTLFNFEIIKLL